MEIAEMKHVDIEQRLSEIETELASETADVEKLSAEVDALQERDSALKKEAEEKRAMMEKVASMSAPIIEEKEERKDNPKMEMENKKALAEALAETIKGTATPEQRALMTAYAQNGTVLYNQIVDNYVWTDWERSTILSRVRKTNVKGSYAIQYEASATPAVIHEEGTDTPAEEELVLGEVVLEPQYVKKWIKVSDNVLALRGQEFLDYLYDEFGYQIAQAIINAVIRVIGISALTADAGNATSATTTIVQALAMLSAEAVNPVAIMNRATWAKIAGYRTTTGDKVVDPFEGIEVIFANAMADDAVYVGDLGGIVVNFPEGEDFKYVADPYTFAEQNMVKIVGKVMVGIALARPHGFVKIRLPLA